MVQPVPLTEYDIAPDPEPPVVVIVMGVPALPLREALEITSAACAAAVNVKTTALLDSLA
jgi:hypothetical protein